MSSVPTESTSGPRGQKVCRPRRRARGRVHVVGADEHELHGRATRWFGAVVHEVEPLHARIGADRLLGVYVLNP